MRNHPPFYSERHNGTWDSPAGTAIHSPIVIRTAAADAESIMRIAACGIPAGARDIIFTKIVVSGNSL